MQQFVFFAASAQESASAATAVGGSHAKDIHECIERFSTSVGNGGAAGAERVLHEHFRVVANQLMGNASVSIIDKQMYLQLLRDGKIGGEQRVVRIHSVDYTGNNACVKVSFEGEKIVFTSYMLLVQSGAGEWSIIGDMPSMMAK